MADVPTCPSCGAELQPVALDPDTPPWHCASEHPPFGMAMGWWAAQLTPEARAAYRQTHGDFGRDQVARDLHVAVLAELAAARARGTSLRPEQLEFETVSTAALERVVGQAKVAANFKAQVEQVLASRKAAR